jgi:hypothetical protein
MNAAMSGQENCIRMRKIVPPKKLAQNNVFETFLMLFLNLKISSVLNKSNIVSILIKLL